MMDESKKMSINHPDGESGLALYRLPGGDEYVLLTGRVCQFHLADSEPGDGYVFYPFDHSRNVGLMLHPQFKQMLAALSSVSPTMNSYLKNSLGRHVSPTKKEEYQSAFDTIFGSMEETRRYAQCADADAPEFNVEKVILSKVVEWKGDLTDRVLQVFEKLCLKYPQAYVSLFASPQSGVWMGATPEILLQRTGNEVKTVALAGTRPAVSGAVWRPKERVEQEFVTNFICQRLTTNCHISNLDVQGPETVTAGPVQHLKTTICFKMSDLNVDLWKVVEALHPTPAVSGTPQEDAMALIALAENHDREYYGGFMGEMNAHSMQLFVNLRCMKVTQQGAALFVGGGLTLDSDRDEEWHETEMKAKTLLQVLNSNE